MKNLNAQDPVAFLSIKTQFDNLGDALINRELCRLLSDRVQTIVDFSRAPVAFERSMGVGSRPNLTSLRRAGFLGLLVEIVRFRIRGRACYLFLNPGGLGGGSLPLKSRMSALAYNAILSVLRVAGLRICHVGISYDVMAGPERFAARWRRALMRSFVVRDLVSYDYVASIGMPADAVIPDLSFNLYDGVQEPPAAGEYIAFSFRFDGKAGRESIERAVSKIIAARGRDVDYVLVVQVARDLAGMQRLRDTLVEAFPGHSISLFVCHDDVDRLSDYYRSCREIYSNRLHALLLAAHAGVSFYALIAQGAQPKIEGMLADLDMNDRIVYVDSEEFSVPDVAPLKRERLKEECVKLQMYFDQVLAS